MESRRSFVKAGLLAALCATVPLKGVFGQSFKERDGNPGETPPTQTDPLANYSKAAFSSYLNSIFQIQSAAGIVEVTLAKIDDMPAAKGGECFSLVFRGGSASLKQNTYMMVHPALGTFHLLLVPGGADQNGAQEYLATINRLSPADFANISAPSRSRTSSTGTKSQPATSTSSSSSANTSTSNSSSNSTQSIAPTKTQTTVSPVVNSPESKPRHRKRMPLRKRVDDKSAVIN